MNVLIEQNSKYGLVVSSRDVAKELRKQHNNVVRDIENILKTENSNLSSIQNNTPQIRKPKCGFSNNIKHL